MHGPQARHRLPPGNTLPIIKLPVFIPGMRPMGFITFYKLSHDLSAHVPFFFCFAGCPSVHPPPCPDSPLRPGKSHPCLLILTIANYIKAHLTNTYRLCYAQIQPSRETGKHSTSDIQGAAKPPVGCRLLILRPNSAFFFLEMKRGQCPTGSAGEEAFARVPVHGRRKKMLQNGMAEMQQDKKPGCSPPPSPPCDHNCQASHPARCKTHPPRIPACAACGGGGKL